MPNFTENFIKFKTQESCSKFKELLIEEDGETKFKDGSSIKNYKVNFNKFIPTDTDSASACSYNWGTKWNARDTYFTEDEEFCYFRTAWSKPLPVLEKLAELSVEFNVGYCSDDTGSSCGLFTTKDKKLVKVIGEGLNTRTELFAFACLLNYSCIDDYLEGQGGEDYIEELKGGNEDAKDFLNLIENAKGEVEEKMLGIIREYDIQY